MEGGSSPQAPKEETLRQHVLMDPELPVPMGTACRRPSVTDQSKASDHLSHQDAGSNESHLDWARDWLVMINGTKTEVTCFSLSPKRQEFILQINGQEIHQQDSAVDLGAKLEN